MSAKKHAQLRKGVQRHNSLFSLLMQLEETGLRSLSSQCPGSFSPQGTLLPSLDQGAYLLHRLLTCFYNSQSPVAPPSSKFWLQPVIPKEDLKFLNHYSKFRTHQTIWKWLSNIKIKATQGKSLKQDKPQNVYCIHILVAINKRSPSPCQFWTLDSVFLSQGS